MGNINLTGLSINCCLSLTTSSSILCGHSDGEGEIMVCICYQGDRNGPLSFDYTVGGLVEPHRDGHCKGNRQSCMTILMWLSRAHNGYVNKHLLDNGGHVESPAMCAQTIN